MNTAAKPESTAEPVAEETQKIEPPKLTPNQRRVLGVLIEKALCTPDQYPMTCNAIVVACNQKSNRDPLMNLPTNVVDEVLFELRDLGLVLCVHTSGGRTERWKHNIREVWDFERPERAVLAELLLRGPQTEGELRTRAGRMAEFATLELLRECLTGLAKVGFVKRLSPEEQKRGILWIHELYPEPERSRLITKWQHVVEKTGEESTVAVSPITSTPKSATNVTPAPTMPAPAQTSTTAVAAAMPAVAPVDQGRLREMETHWLQLQEQVLQLTAQLQELQQEIRETQQQVGLLKVEVQQLRTDLGG